MVLKRKIISFLRENPNGKTSSEISLSVGFNKYDTLTALYELQKTGYIVSKQSGEEIYYHPASRLKTPLHFFKLVSVLAIIFVAYIAYLSYTSITGYFLYGGPAISPDFVSNSELSLGDISKKDDIFSELSFDNSTSFEARFIVNKTGKYILSLVYEADAGIGAKILFENQTIAEESNNASEINLPLELSQGENTFEFVFISNGGQNGKIPPGQITGFFIAEEGASEGSDSEPDGPSQNSAESSQEQASTDKGGLDSDAPQSALPDSLNDAEPESPAEPALIGIGEDSADEPPSDVQNIDVDGLEYNSSQENPAGESSIPTVGSEDAYEPGNSSQGNDAKLPPDNASEKEPVLNGSLPANDANPEINQSIKEINETNDIPETNDTNELPETNETNQNSEIPEINESSASPVEVNDSDESSAGKDGISKTGNSGHAHIRIDYLALIPEIEAGIEGINFSNEANESFPDENVSLNQTDFENKIPANDTGLLEISYSKLVQGKIVINEPVKWVREVSISNPYDYDVSEELALDIPSDAENISVYNDLNEPVSSSLKINITLSANQKKDYALEFYTSPVEIEIINQDLSLLDLLPPEARNISVYEGSKKIAYFRNFLEANIDIPGSKKKIFVYHNSSLHYYNISVSLLEIGEAGTAENLSVDTTMNQNLPLISAGDKSSFVIPKLSGVNLTVKPEIETIQQEAKVGEPVKWKARIANMSIDYETPAPLKEERLSQNGKTVKVYSNASVHYKNIAAFTDLPNLTYAPKIYWMASQENFTLNGTDGLNMSEGYGEKPVKTDISSDPKFNVSYIDNDSDGRYERMEWIVPHLSEQTFEISFVILNVQSYPVVGYNWTVSFTTSGAANLTIRAVNGTVWSNYSELAKTPNMTEGYDLKFLNLTCGDEAISYEWTNDSVFVENYTCNETGFESSKVLSGGKHHLEFSFGDLVAYAHNSAVVEPIACGDASGASCSSTCINRAYVCDTASFSGCKIVMTDRRGACDDSTALSSNFDSASCTNWDNGEACLSVGSSTNYFYAWAQHTDARVSTSLSIFNTGNINGDTCVGFCDCLLGQGRWSIGGETAPTACCGDDASEYPRVKTFDSTMDRVLTYSRICCDASTDCVNSGSCYASGTSNIDADGDGDNDTCSSGVWVD